MPQQPTLQPIMGGKGHRKGSACKLKSFPGTCLYHCDIFQSHTPSLKGEHQPTSFAHTAPAPHGACPCSPRLPGKASGSAHSTCGLGPAVEGFHPPSSSQDRRASRTQMDNVSNTTHCRDCTAGNLLPKEEIGHVHKYGHCATICASWNNQCSQFHGWPSLHPLHLQIKQPVATCGR